MATVTLLDGGMGRELKRSGAPFHQPEWSAAALSAAPESVAEVHRRFIHAGCAVITTNNYAVVPFHIGAERFELEGEALTELAGRLAVEAASEGVRVAGSLPPLAGSYRPDLFDPAMAEQLYPRIVAALAPFVDVWLGETISCLAEATAICTALRERDKPLWLAFTLDDDTGTAPRLRSGESIDTACELAEAEGADGVLFNCSVPEVIGAAIAAVGAVPDRPFVFGGYANAFTPRPVDTEANSEIAALRDEITPEAYADTVMRWVDDGASVVGGCCGIGPEHIAALRARLG
ncbi:MAG: homocysteine S-methyltransferase family protein [Pseudomonadota bacterium]